MDWLVEPVASRRLVYWAQGAAVSGSGSPEALALGAGVARLKEPWVLEVCELPLWSSAMLLWLGYSRSMLLCLLFVHTRGPGAAPRFL